MLVTFGGKECDICHVLKVSGPRRQEMDGVIVLTLLLGDEWLHLWCELPDWASVAGSSPLPARYPHAKRTLSARFREVGVRAACS